MDYSTAVLVLGAATFLVALISLVVKIIELARREALVRGLGAPTPGPQ